jgi:hypothetical protein
MPEPGHREGACRWPDCAVMIQNVNTSEQLPSVLCRLTIRHLMHDGTTFLKDNVALSLWSPHWSEVSVPSQKAARFRRNSSHSHWNRATSCGSMQTGSPDASPCDICQLQRERHWRGAAATSLRWDWIVTVSRALAGHRRRSYPRVAKSDLRPLRCDGPGRMLP